MYRTKVTNLAEALENPESRTAATEALRGLVEQITLVPDADQLRIDLQGNLAAMLGAATNAKKSPEAGDLLLQVSMVAGARSRLYRPRSTSWRHDYGGRICIGATVCFAHLSPGIESTAAFTFMPIVPAISPPAARPMPLAASVTLSSCSPPRRHLDLTTLGSRPLTSPDLQARIPSAPQTCVMNPGRDLRAAGRRTGL